MCILYYDHTPVTYGFRGFFRERIMNNPKKPFTSVEEVEILCSRGLNVSDRHDTELKLLHNNYYTVINGYKYPFLDQGCCTSNEVFKSGASFSELFALYTFDCNLRALLFEYILKVEHQLKSVISHQFAEKYPNQVYPDYLTKENFDVDRDGKLPSKKETRYSKLRLDIERELNHQVDNNNPMIKHYKEKYNNLPPWILISIFSFGMLRSFYYCLNNSMQNDIARVFGLKPDRLASYLSALNLFRNACAHDERIYNTRLHNRVSRIDKEGNKKEYETVYVIVLILKDMLDAPAFMSFYSKLDGYITELAQSLKTIDISQILNEMGMPIESAVRKNELGPLSKGCILSSTEFYEVLKKYIVPLFPITAELNPISKDDIIKKNRACKMIECNCGLLYFAQSTDSEFEYIIRLNDGGKNVDMSMIVEDASRHLTTLINYLHVFWNLGEFSSYRSEKISAAFPILCEQAYELAICSLICKRDNLVLYKNYNALCMKRKQIVGSIDSSILSEIEAEISRELKQIHLIEKIEDIADKTLYSILRQIATWSSKTYEGQKKTFGIIVCKDLLCENGKTFNYIDFLKSDYSATINDGVYSAVELYADGSFKSHLAITQPKGCMQPSIPYPFAGFASLCHNGKIGILLTETEDIFVICDEQLCYTRHNDIWIRSKANMIIEHLIKELHLRREEASVIYQSITDVSYSRGGACIGIIEDDVLPQKLHDMLEAGLLLNKSKSSKLEAIRTLLSTGGDSMYRQQSFFSINRALRRELLELDGAMVLSSSGYIHAAGTIIRLEGVDNLGGGRTAAAMQLSEFGTAIKVSQDGYVEIFKQREPILKMFT